MCVPKFGKHESFCAICCQTYSQEIVPLVYNPHKFTTPYRFLGSMVSSVSLPMLLMRKVLPLIFPYPPLMRNWCFSRRVRMKPERSSASGVAKQTSDFDRNSSGAKLAMPCFAPHSCLTFGQDAQCVDRKKLSKGIRFFKVFFFVSRPWLASLGAFCCVFARLSCLAWTFHTNYRVFLYDEMTN